MGRRPKIKPQYFFGILSETNTTLEVVKYTKGTVFETRMIRIKILKHFFKSKDYMNCFNLVEISTTPVLSELNITEPITERQFNQYYKILVRKFLGEI
jgi:hypothetical protein